MEKEKKNHPIMVAVTKQQREQITKLAEKEGRTLSDYCRRKALGL